LLFFAALFPLLACAQTSNHHVKIGLVSIRALYSDTSDPAKNKANSKEYVLIVDVPIGPAAAAK
jgi:hypothetical protein